MLLVYELWMSTCPWISSLATYHILQWQSGISAFQGNFVFMCIDWLHVHSKKTSYVYWLVTRTLEKDFCVQHLWLFCPVFFLSQCQNIKCGEPFKSVSRLMFSFKVQKSSFEGKIIFLWSVLWAMWNIHNVNKEYFCTSSCSPLHQCTSWVVQNF